MQSFDVCADVCNRERRSSQVQRAHTGSSYEAARVPFVSLEEDLRLGIHWLFWVKTRHGRDVSNFIER